MDLSTFLLARLDEDEQLARAATERQPIDEWTAIGAGDNDDIALSHWGVVRIARMEQTPAARSLAQHIARHDPARVLAEVETKRQLIARLRHEIQVGIRNGDEHFTECSCGWEAISDHDGRDLDVLYDRHLHDVHYSEAVTIAVLRLLALPYAKHPEYAQEWKP